MNRSVTPWIIFSGHRPMYSSSDLIPGLDLMNGPWWPEVEQLLLKHEVDLCLWGHNHNAEVTCPLRNGTCANTTSPNEYGGIVHAIIGNAGQSLSKFTQGGFDWSMWRTRKKTSRKISRTSSWETSQMLLDRGVQKRGIRTVSHVVQQPAAPLSQSA